MEKTKTLAVEQPQESTVMNFFGNSANFKDGWNIASILAKSDLVPVTFKGKPENIIIAMNMAQRINADVLMVMQNLVPIHGIPTFEAKFSIACFNATGKYSPIRYKTIGKKGTDSYGIVAYAIEKATGDVVEGVPITIEMAKSEGWYDKNPKWKSVPELMLRYRAASWFIRTTDPGIMMGFQTREDMEDFTNYEEVSSEINELEATAQTVAKEAKTTVEEGQDSNNLPVAEKSDIPTLFK